MKLKKSLPEVSGIGFHREVVSICSVVKTPVDPDIPDTDRKIAILRIQNLVGRFSEQQSYIFL